MDYTKKTKGIVLLVVILALVSCKTRYASSSQRDETRTIETLQSKDTTFVPVEPNLPKKVITPVASRPKSMQVNPYHEQDSIVQIAQTFIGTPYRYGGVSTRGMDCSGLVYKVYGQLDYDLPRSSFAMSGEGTLVDQDNIQKGDLIFFRTTSRVRISHVGIVSRVEGDNVFFIHASGSRGVIESSLQEKYYAQRLVQINRVLK